MAVTVCRRAGGVQLTGGVTQCYSTGAVMARNVVGGLVGYNGSRMGTVTQSFWDIQTSGQTTSAGGTGKTTAEMQTAKTFLDAGWDFVGETANGTEDIWWIDEGKDYPTVVVGVHVVYSLARTHEWCVDVDPDLNPELARRGRGHRVRRVLRQRPQPRGQCDEESQGVYLRPTAGGCDQLRSRSAGIRPDLLLAGR